jgi:hypothetical protein
MFIAVEATVTGRNTTMETGIQSIATKRAAAQAKVQKNAAKLLRVDLETQLNQAQ